MIKDERKEKSADESENVVSDTLKFRFRTFLLVIALLAVCDLIALSVHGTQWAKAAIACTGIFVGFGVPWLGWHLRIRFIGRVMGPLLQLSGVALHGWDPRDNLWALADLPVLFFLLGWFVDLCFSARSKTGSIAGRFLFTLLWLRMMKSNWSGGDEGAWLAVNLAGILLGIIAVWLPRGQLLPRRFRVPLETQIIVDRGMEKAGGWIASRAGIAILLLLPSLIFLDVLELPPLLRSQLQSVTQADTPAPAHQSLKDEKILFWLREGRALTAADWDHLEVHAAAPDASMKVIDAILLLRRSPRDPSHVEALRKLSQSRVADMKELALYRGALPVFYVELLPGDDGRATSGMFSVPDSKWADRDELRLISGADLERRETQVRRATFVILASGILILMLFGGPNGGGAAAWWLAIFLAGVNMGWARESLDLIVERVRFVMWRDYSDFQAGGTMFSIHSLLLFLARSAEWLTNNLVVHAGIWVALCWPARPHRLLRSILDRIWVQAAKVVVLAFMLSALRLLLFLCVSNTELAFTLWFLLFPVLLVSTGIWWRRRTRPGVRLPVVGKMAALAFVLRGWVPVFFVFEDHWSATGYGIWIGHAGVMFTLIATVLLIMALERGTFLSPPHVEGQVWLICVAALPFIESIVGDPVSGVIEGTGLFLGTTDAWLAFAAAVWLIGPVSSFVGARLSRWRAQGLEQIEEAHDKLKSLPCCPTAEHSESPLDLCFKLIAELNIHQPQLWRHVGMRNLQRLEASAATGQAPQKILSGRLAEQLGEVEGSLRLEEMRLEWKWAGFQTELDHWFATHGDLLLVPASHNGALLGILWAPDVPQNRFLLRPAVSAALGGALATALLISAHRRTSTIGLSANAPQPAVAPVPVAVRASA